VAELCIKIAKKILKKIGIRTKYLHIKHPKPCISSTNFMFCNCFFKLFFFMSIKLQEVWNLIFRLYACQFSAAYTKWYALWVWQHYVIIGPILLVFKPNLEPRCALYIPFNVCQIRKQFYYEFVFYDSFCKCVKRRKMKRMSNFLRLPRKGWCDLLQI